MLENKAKRLLYRNLIDEQFVNVMSQQITNHRLLSHDHRNTEYSNTLVWSTGWVTGTLSRNCVSTTRIENLRTFCCVLSVFLILTCCDFHSTARRQFSGHRRGLIFNRITYLTVDLCRCKVAFSRVARYGAAFVCRGCVQEQRIRENQLFSLLRIQFFLNFF